MKCVVLVPTRDRPELLQRALISFVAAVLDGPIDIARVVIADDSSDATATQAALGTVQKVFPNSNFAYLSQEAEYTQPNGPGQTRNRGLDYIVQSDIDHDCLIFFDDDICFDSCVYQGEPFSADAKSLLIDIVSACSRDKFIMGCQFVGRQDLSILEHLHILATTTGKRKLLASTQRKDVKHVGPQGLSSAFLFVPAHASELPRFVPWYNEDYFWLARMANGGWTLQQSAHALIHAPTDGLKVCSERFWFEQYGETLWGALHTNHRNESRRSETSLAATAVRQRIREIRNIERFMMRDNKGEPWSEVAASLAHARAKFDIILKNIEENRAEKILEDIKFLEKYLEGADN